MHCYVYITMTSFGNSTNKIDALCVVQAFAHPRPEDEGMWVNTLLEEEGEDDTHEEH